MIPYIPNESAYHHGTFDNTHYFGIIDCIKNENIAELNKISPQKVYEEDFNELVKAYKNYSESAAKAVKGLGEDIDYKALLNRGLIWREELPSMLLP